MSFQRMVDCLNIKRNILFLLIFASIFFVAASPGYSLNAYGDDAYGQCKYSEGCLSESPNTVVTVPASPLNPADGRAFSVNLKSGQIFTVKNYQILVTPNFSSEQILKVALYLDGIEIQSVEAIESESFKINWIIPKNGEYNLSVKIFLKDGTAIEKSFDVSVRNRNDANNSLNSPDTQTDKQSNKILGFTYSPEGLFGRILAYISRPAAYLIPYGLISAITLVLLALLVQTQNQLKYITAMIDLLEKDKLLFEEKATFIKLISHHIRTPLTILRGGVETYAFENPKMNLEQTKESIGALGTNFEQLLSDTQQNKQLQRISPPNMTQAKVSLYGSWKLIVPIILSIMLVFLLNVIFISAGKTKIIIPNLVVQIVLIIGLIIGFWTLLQTRQNNISRQNHLKKQLKYQLNLDKARNNFIKQAASKITPLLIEAKQSCLKAIPATQRQNIDEALSRLGSLLERFNLASELEKGKVEAAFSEIRPAILIQSSLNARKQEIQAKNLTTSVDNEDAVMIQNEYLSLYIISALLDNAVNYAHNNTEVVVKVEYLNNNQEVRISIKDQGVVIDKQKIENLFKPFSRSDDVVQFDKQGAGINLYLSRLIAKYLGGDITLTSLRSNQTIATVKLPNKA